MQLALYIQMQILQGFTFLFSSVSYLYLTLIGKNLPFEAHLQYFCQSGK